MVKFSKRLETHCSLAVAQHARKLRPNYDGKWIVNLKTQLSNFEKAARQGGTGSSAGGSKARKAH